MSARWGPLLATIVVVVALTLVWRLILSVGAAPPVVTPEAGAKDRPSAELAQGNQAHHRHERESRTGPSTPEVMEGDSVGGCSDPNIDQKEAIHIRGIVLDSHKDPVGGAVVACAENAEEAATLWSGARHDGLRWHTHSDRDGHFELGPFAAPPVGGTRTLYAHAPGFGLAVREGVPAVAEGVVITLHRAQTVEGVVADEAGKAIEGAKVTWRFWPGPHGFPSGTAVSDKQGAFRLSGLPLFVTIEAVAAGFSPTLIEVRGVNTKATRVSMTLAKSRTVKGIVASVHTGSPISGATVELWIVENDDVDANGRMQYGTRIVGRATTNDKGVFVLIGAPGPAPHQKTHAISGGRSVYLWAKAKGHAPTLLDTERVSCGQVVLVPSGSISGKVMRPAAVPAAGERVVALPSAVAKTWPRAAVAWRRWRLGYNARAEAKGVPPWVSVWESTTDAAGKFVIEDVPEGTTEVVVRSRRRPEARTIVETAAEEVRDVGSLITPDGADVAIQGRVESDDGKAITGARIAVGGEYRNSDEDGRFSVPYPVPDRDRWGEKPRIDISCPGFGEITEEVERDWIAGERRFVLRKAVRVVGHVIDANGCAVANAHLHLKAGVDEIATSRRGVVLSQPGLLGAQSNEAGRFRQDAMGLGTVEVLAAYPDRVRGPFFGRGSFLVSGTAEEIRLQIAELDVKNFGAADVTVKLLDVVTGQPILVPVCAQLERHGVIWERREGKEGVVVIQDVPGPVKYDLRVSARGFGAVSDVLHTWGGRPTEHCVQFGAGATIVGRMVTKKSVRAGSATLLGDGGASDSRIGEDGAFEFRGVREGSYRVSGIARSEDGERCWVVGCRRVEVRGSEAVSVVLHGRPARVLWVALLDPSCVQEDVAEIGPPSVERQPPGRGFTSYRGGLRVQVKDAFGEIWYDGPPNVFRQGRRSRQGYQVVHARVGEGAYSVMVTEGGKMLASGSATPGRVCTLRIPGTR